MVQPPSSAAVGGGGALVAQKRYPQEEEKGEREREEIGGQEEGHVKHACSHSVLLPSDEQADHGAEQLHHQLDLPLHAGESEGGGSGGGGKLPSFPLVGLLVLFFFLYVGIEVGFGAWVAVVVLRDGLAGETGAALMVR